MANEPTTTAQTDEALAIQLSDERRRHNLSITQENLSYGNVTRDSACNPTVPLQKAYPIGRVPTGYPHKPADRNLSSV
jgi:hypothetical protein